MRDSGSGATSAPRTPRPRPRSDDGGPSCSTTRHPGSGIAASALDVRAARAPVGSCAAALLALSPQTRGGRPHTCATRGDRPGTWRPLLKRERQRAQREERQPRDRPRARSALLARGYRVLMTRNSDRTCAARRPYLELLGLGRQTWAFRARLPHRLVGGFPETTCRREWTTPTPKVPTSSSRSTRTARSSRSSHGTETYASRKDYLGRRLSVTVSREIVPRHVPA